MDAPTTDKFIVNTSIIGDWRIPQNANLWQGKNGVNNPCPSSWRIPTDEEWTAEGLASLPDAFSKLKLTFTGFRTPDNTFFFTDRGGLYWTSNTLTEESVGYSNDFEIYKTSAGANQSNRGNGMACRCIKD
jgi:hypothetical protein